MIKRGAKTPILLQSRGCMDSKRVARGPVTNSRSGTGSLQPPWADHVSACYCDAITRSAFRHNLLLRTYEVCDRFLAEGHVHGGGVEDR